MSDDYNPRERSRSREPRNPEPVGEAPRDEFKAFVGGISWQLDDGKLKEGAVLDPMVNAG
jgi:hypothetical protein